MPQTSPTPDSPAPPAAAASPAWLRAALLLLFAVSLAQAGLLVHAGALHGNDFKHLWLGARLLAHGQNPYDAQAFLRAAALSNLDAVNPYVYLPTTGLAMRPLAALSFPVAQLAWFWSNWALAWVTVLGGPGWMRVGRPGLARLAGAAFLAGAFPFARQMTAGQMNVVTAALLVWGAGALARRSEGSAGLSVGLGFAWKIAPALLAPALLVLRRRAAGMLALISGAILLILSVLALGWPVHAAALATLRQMGYGRSTFAEAGEDFYRSPFNQSINSLMHHLFTQNPHTTPWIDLGPAAADWLTRGAAVALVALWVWAARRRMRSAGDTAAVPLFLAATLLMLLLPSLMWDHYAVQALPALFWVFGDARTARNPLRAAAAMIIFALLAIPWIHQAPDWREGAGILMMSIRLWPVVGLFGWLLGGRFSKNEVQDEA